MNLASFLEKFCGVDDLAGVAVGVLMRDMMLLVGVFVTDLSLWGKKHFQKNFFCTCQLSRTEAIQNRRDRTHLQVVYACLLYLTSFLTVMGHTN